MRIALFTGSFLPLYNGVVSYVLDISAELSRRGHTVLLFAPKPQRGVRLKLSRYPFKVILLSSFPAMVYPDLRITLPALPKILLSLRTFHADIVHTNDFMPICTEGVAAAKLLHIPSVITYHTFLFDNDMLKNLHFGERLSFLKKPLSVLNSRYHNLATLVICPSREAQKELLRYGLTRPNRVIHNGIHIEDAKLSDDTKLQKLKKRYGLVPKDHVAVFTGRLSKDKKIDVLLGVWEQVLRTVPSAKLLIIGKGPMEESLQNQARLLGIEGQVIFTGGIPREELLQSGYYALAQLFISASAIENQSVSMLEAMSFGLPLVVVEKRGTSEMIDPSFGILVPPNRPPVMAKVIVSLFQNEHLRKTMSDASRVYAARYDIGLTVDQLEQAYRSIL